MENIDLLLCLVNYLFTMVKTDENVASFVGSSEFGEKIFSCVKKQLEISQKGSKEAYWRLLQLVGDNSGRLRRLRNKIARMIDNFNIFNRCLINWGHNDFTSSFSRQTLYFYENSVMLCS